MVIATTPEATYQAFFEADAQQNAEAWANVLHYPHVRVAANGKFELYQTLVEYAAQASWTERKATGWVRTEGIATSRTHNSAEKVHLAGGWIRRNEDGDSILENRVLYVLTKINADWGIQARFACGAAESWKPGIGEEARRFVEAFLSSMKKGALCECLSMMNDDFVCVLQNKVEVLPASLPTLQCLEESWKTSNASTEIKTIQDGVSGANIGIVFRGPDKKNVGVVMLVSKKNQSTEILALSII